MDFCHKETNSVPELLRQILAVICPDVANMDCCARTTNDQAKILRCIRDSLCGKEACFTFDDDDADWAGPVSGNYTFTTPPSNRTVANVQVWSDQGAGVFEEVGIQTTENADGSVTITVAGAGNRFAGKLCVRYA
jgi:hypothetical protein